MNSRERFRRAIFFEKPDRAPVMHRTLPGAFIKYGRELEELYERYPSDALLSPKSRAPFAISDRVSEGMGPADHAVDAWGCVWRSVTADYLGQVIDWPLRSWDRLDDLKTPDPLLGSEVLQELADYVQADRHQHYVIVGISPLWHRMTYLRGFEEICLDLAEGPPEVAVLRDQVLVYVLRQIELWLDVKQHIDGIIIGDDWGTQQALMIRPELWRGMFKDAYRRIAEAIHSGGLTAHFHTDGVTKEILPDLIEIGFDEVNPQLSCMDVEELGRLIGGKVCVRADLDRQWTLPFGAPADVKAHALRAFTAFSAGGGYVGYGQIGPDVPLANAEAMLNAFYEMRYE